MKKIILILALMLSASFAVMAKSGEAETEKKPFDRGIGISTSTFIPKGTVGAGVAFSYNNFLLGNGANDAGYSALMSLIGGVHGEMLTFGVAPWASYFLMDNLSVGVRFDYDRTSLGLGNASISLGDLANFSISDFHFLVVKDRLGLQHIFLAARCEYVFNLRIRQLPFKLDDKQIRILHHDFILEEDDDKPYDQRARNNERNEARPAKNPCCD